MFLDYPLFGIGRGAYYDHFEEYAVRVDPWLVPRPRGPHNIPIHILAETGIIGLLGYGAAVIAGLLTLRRARSRFMAAGLERPAALVEATEIAVYGFLVSAMLVNDNMYQRLLWMLIALGMAARHVASELAGEEPAPVVATGADRPDRPPAFA
jgi:O-antigen ligase